MIYIIKLNINSSYVDWYNLISAFQESSLMNYKALAISKKID
jgi:hypothetical protein